MTTQPDKLMDLRKEIVPLPLKGEGARTSLRHGKNAYPILPAPKRAWKKTDIKEKEAFLEIVACAFGTDAPCLHLCGFFY